MSERYTLYSKRTIFVDDRFFRSVYGMEFYLEFEPLTECLDLRIEHRAQFFRAINPERCRTTEHPKRGDHADKTETMVAMEMGDEYTTDLGKPNSRLTKLHLSTFSAVDHEEFLSDFHHLRRGIMLKCGKG